MTQLKLALIGCGGIAQEHWRGIQTGTKRIKVTAVVDANLQQAQAMAERTGATAFGSLEDALAHGDFDAVDIMLPHYLHEEVAVRAFEAGKHVVLEKPMSTSLESCGRIFAAARHAGTVFMVAEQSQYWPDAIKIQKLIQAGAIGEVITARAVFAAPERPLSGPRPWRYDLAKSGGGITMDGGAHWLRPLRMWLGEIDEVIGVTGYPLAGMDGESLTHALLRFKTGVVAVFDTLHAGAVHGGGEEFRITGTMGEIITERGFTSGGVVLYDHAHPQGMQIMLKQPGRSASFGYELEDFECAVLDGTRLQATPEYSLGELQTAFAIYRSALTRQWEKVWLD